MTENIRTLLSRWDTFLANMSERFYQTVDEAEDSLRQMASGNEEDLQALLVAWAGIRQQLIGLIGRIDDTWRQQLESPMRYRTGPDFDWSVEYGKGHNLTNKLHEELSYRETTIMGKCAAIYYQKAVAAIRLNFHCKQCKAPLTVTDNIFRSHYMDCLYCNAVNTYEPGTLTRSIEWFAVDHLARYNSLPEQQVMDEALCKIDYGNYKVGWPAYEAAYYAYWEKYLRERIRLLPELATHYDGNFKRREAELKNIKDQYIHI